MFLYSERDLNPHSHHWPKDFKSFVSTDSTIGATCGAENETRTRDPNLGKVVLYQLSYFRRLFLQRGCKGTRFFEHDKIKKRKIESSHIKSPSIRCG